MGRHRKAHSQAWWPVLFSAGLFLAGPPPAAGSAQTKPEGQGIAILTTGYYWADANFDRSYGKDTTPFGGNGRFDKIAESLWFEYGYTDDLNFLFSMETAHLTFQNDSRKSENTGFGNPKFGAKYRFWNPEDLTASMWAVQADIEPPLRAGGSPSLGYREVEMEAALVASRRSEAFGWPFSVSGSLGYRFRAGGAADEWRAKYSLSRGASGWLYWAGIDAQFSVGNERNPTSSTNPQQAPDFDRVTVSTFVSRRLTRSYWIQLGGAIDVAGRNTGQGKEVKLGIWYTF